MGTNTDKNTPQYALVFKCCERKKCLALIRLKAEAPWVAASVQSDGTTIASGAVINSLQYGGNLRKKIQRSCILCKKRKQKSR